MDNSPSGGDTAKKATAVSLLGTMTLGQSPASTAPPPQQADNRIFAELDKLMYAKKVKSGDVVTAYLTAPAKLPDGREMAKGTELVGTITDVKAKADKEGPSKMGLLFTTVEPKNNKAITVSMVLVTVVPHIQQNDVNLLSAGSPFSGSNRMQGRHWLQHT